MPTQLNTARIRAISRDIRSFSEDGRTSVERVLQPILELVGGHTAASYRVQSDGVRLGLEYVHAVGALATLPFESVMQRSVAQARGRFGLYDPLNPEPLQRNKALRVGTVRMLIHETATQLERFKRLGIDDSKRSAVVESIAQYARNAMEPLGIMDHHQTRVLVCDGPSMLAWVGCFSDEAMPQKAADALQRLVPVLRQRLKLESELRLHTFHTNALATAMEALGAAATICSGDGHVLHANQAARSRIDLGDGAFTELVRAAVEAAASGREPQGAQVNPITSQASRPSYLVVERTPPKDLNARLHTANRRWGFTSRQLEVLALLVAGEMNRTIAATLHCSERTVEIHVTNIFDRMGVDCRSAAVARFYEET